MATQRFIVSMFIAAIFFLPSAALADTVDLRIELIGLGLQYEPNYEAEFLVNRSPTPSAYGQNSFTLFSDNVTVLSDTIPFASSSVFPLLFSPGEIALDDPNVGAAANLWVYALGFNTTFFPAPSPNFYIGTNAAPSFVDGAYIGPGFLGAGYTDHLYISSAMTTTPIALTPEPSSMVLMLTALIATGYSLVRRNIKAATQP